MNLAFRCVNMAQFITFQWPIQRVLLAIHPHLANKHSAASGEPGSCPTGALRAVNSEDLTKRNQGKHQDTNYDTL